MTLSIEEGVCGWGELQTIGAGMVGLEAGPGVLKTIGEKVLEAALVPFDKAGLDRGAYRSIIDRIGDESSVSFVDKNYVYKRGIEEASAPSLASA